ncbi:hypothetical protein Amme3_00089 [Pseudomonas phage vB_PpuM-Amme-3]|uniref:Uncharacterized protein n=1 Tax=Pseudomonas phage vB_PpuM-Amme-3 TaxID=3132617 RepID=A0AAX4MWM6_9CAUD
MTKAKDHGIILGVDYVITGNNTREDHGLANHKFQIGEAVQLKRDDGTLAPEFVNSSGEKWFVHVDNVELAKDSGPKAGVRWTDAPKGATHYAMCNDYFSKWHKIEDGVLSFWNIERQEWLAYGNQQWRERYQLVEAPVVKVKKKPVVKDVVQPAVENLKSELARVEQRLTRTGSKLGRAQKRVADVQEAFDALKVEQAKLKQAIAKAPVVPKITDAKELVELMHDASKWKAGMRVVNRDDITSGITVGQKYVLTQDARTNHHVSIYFDGDNGSHRMRPAKHYQLVTTDLV